MMVLIIMKHGYIGRFIMKRINYIVKFLIVLILSILFFMCAPQDSGSSSGGESGGHSDGDGDGSSSSSSSSGFQNTWTNLNPSIPVPSTRTGHFMVYVGNNKIILFGGIDNSATSNNDTWKYR